MFKIFLDLINIQPTKDLILIKRLGKGSFGQVYLCFDISQNKLIAVKLEIINQENSLLHIEYNLYQELNKNNQNIFPKVYKLIRDNNFIIMQMQLLGYSIEDMVQKNVIPQVVLNHYFIQILEQLEALNQLGYIHRDIKPENFAIDSQDPKKIYLIDFGLIKKYTINGEHIPFQKNKKLCGTPRYASLNSHFGYELSRRDDLISLGYMMVYCLKGRLPWQNTFAKDKEEKIQKIKIKKLQTSVQSLTKDLPFHYEKYINYVKSLEFSSDPNYNYIKSFFSDCQENYEFEYLNQFQIDYDSKYIQEIKNLSFQEQIDYLDNI